MVFAKPRGGIDILVVTRLAGGIEERVGERIVNRLVRASGAE